MKGFNEAELHDTEMNWEATGRIQRGSEACPPKEMSFIVFRRGGRRHRYTSCAELIPDNALNALHVSSKLISSLYSIGSDWSILT